MKSKTNAARGGKLPTQFSITPECVQAFSVLWEGASKFLLHSARLCELQDKEKSGVFMGDDESAELQGLRRMGEALALLNSDGSDIRAAIPAPDSAANGAQLCDCGAVGAWHGDRCGLREFCCDACWAVSGHNPDRVAPAASSSPASDKFKLAEFGAVVLELLEDSQEWNADTLDDISTHARNFGLASTSSGQFVRSWAGAPSECSIPVNPETLAMASAVVGSHMAGVMLGAPGVGSVPFFGMGERVRVLPAHETYAGHFARVRGITAEDCLLDFGGVAQDWVGRQFLEAAPLAPVSILPPRGSCMDTRRAVLVLVVNASGGLVSADVEWSDHPGKRPDVAGGWRVEVIPLSLALAAPSLLAAAQECSPEITRVNQAAGQTVFNPAATGLLREALAAAGAVPSGWASVVA